MSYRLGFLKIIRIILMSLTSKGERKYQSKSEKPSCVLLVCVYDTVVFQISTDLIREKFERFGTITKLLIFEKGEVTKFFIEYQDQEQASKAKNALDSTKLCDSICKMTIYYSNFNNVEVRHDPENDSENFNRFETLKSTEGDFEFSNDKWMEKPAYFDGYGCEETYFNPFAPFSRSKTDNPRTLEDHIRKLSHTDKPYVVEEEEVDSTILKSIDELIGPSRGQTKFVSEWKQKQIVPDPAVLKLKQKTDVRSSVIWFPYRYPLKPTQLYNLFSNFGNISCICLKNQMAFLKFRTKQFAAIACTYLNNTVLEGEILALKETPEISDSWKPEEGIYCQCVYYDPSFDRFTANRSITINPPSNTLHVSSMKRDICKESTLKNIFGEYGQVQRIQILKQSNEKNMALVRFRSVEDSFRAIANLHNAGFSGRKMQISFTKSKV